MFSNDKYYSLKSIYLNKFNNNIKKYFKNKLEDKLKNKKNNNNKLTQKASLIMLENPFYNNDEIPLRNIIKNNKLNSNAQHTYSSLINLFDNSELKYSFYYSCEMLLENENKEDLFKFIDKFKFNLILILFNLYLIKKNIYENYLVTINRLFNINNSSSFYSNNSISLSNNSNSSSNNNSNSSNSSTNNTRSKAYSKKIVLNTILTNNKYKLNELLNLKNIDIKNFQNTISNIILNIKQKCKGNTSKCDKIILDLEKKSKEEIIKRFLNK